MQASFGEEAARRIHHSTAQLKNHDSSMFSKKKKKKTLKFCPTTNLRAQITFSSLCGLLVVKFKIQNLVILGLPTQTIPYPLLSPHHNKPP
jgi:hypothetical protein